MHPPVTFRHLIAGLLVLCIATTAQATGGVVAAPQPIAAEYGAKVLRDGGNAIDAAVATALMMGVVDGHNSGIGGGCFINIRTADGETLCIDGRETAPALATRDMFIRDGKAESSLSLTGPLASGVPGSLAAYDLALREHGTKSLAELLRGAADVAEEGFALDSKYAARLRGAADTLRQFPGSAALLLKEDGSPYEEGEILRLPDLAKTYRAVADNGIAWFYGGPFAEVVDEWMRENDGMLRAEDFAAYEAKVRQPVVTRYRGHTVIGMAPPSSGGVHVGQMLNILENFELSEMDEATRLHVIAEAMKLAFADRAYWLGDPDFAAVPKGLASEEYARELAKRIDKEQVTEVEGAGQPPEGERVFEQFSGDTPSPEGEGVSGIDGNTPSPSGEAVAPTFITDPDEHTAHLSVADEEGNWVALTATVNTGFGSKVVVPGTGVVLNNQMDDFAAQPGVPNTFGLVGAEANAVAAGKRPLSSMSPTIVLRGEGEDARPVLAVGGAGGPRIISATLMTILNVLDERMPLDEAVSACRIHHQWSPDGLLVERRLADEVIEALQAMGHEVEETGAIAVVQAVGVDEEGNLVAVADPRAPGGTAKGDR